MSQNKNVRGANMGNSDDLMSRLREKMYSFSKGQKRVANYIITNYDKAVYLTAARLGKAAMVSESTVVRFAMQLGYEGYPEFQEALEELVRTKLNSIQRIEIASSKMTQSEVLENILDADAEKIKITKEEIDKGAFEEAVNMILSAKKIYIIGIRSCAPLANFLSFYLNLLFDDVRNIYTNNSSEIFEQMIRISEDDVIIGISFPRYSVRTLKALEFASNRKAKVVAITDSKHSPMNLYATSSLIARSDMASFVDSLVAPLSLINALIVALSMKKKDEVINNLETLEDIWDEYQVYNKDEVTGLDENVFEKMKNIGEKNE